MKPYKMTRFIYLMAIIFVFFICTFFACTGSTGDTGGGSDSSGTGRLSLGLTDASTEDYKAVYVSIKEVQVCSGGESDDEENTNWKVVAEPNATYNLLELVNGVIEQLGLSDLEAGHYTQLRMIINDTADDGTNINGETHPFANYIIDQTNAYKELKIPSGYQTGIKIVHGFDIAEDQLTELVLDFDVLKSVVKAGASGKWILKPTIKVVDRLVSALISGIVFDADTNALEGAMVSAQTYDPNAEDIKDRLVNHGQAISKEDGYYFMYLWPGTNKIVLYKDGYLIICKNIEVESNTSYVQNFTIETTETGTINGEVTIEGAVEDQTSVLSFRTVSECDGSTEEPIEVISETIADGGSYSINLPPGTYQLVASTEGMDSQVYDNIEVTFSNITIQDVTF